MFIYCVVMILHKGSHTLYKGIIPKGNIALRLDFELAYYDTTVQFVNHNATGTLFPAYLHNSFINLRFCCLLG